jgi:zinc protease
METTPIQLANGLTILVRETHHNPVVTVDAWVNTGSVNETPEINGVSHFLEHMLFKGTSKRGPNELDMMIEAVGGNWNAGTSKDYTHYYCTVASPHKRIAVDAVADMLRNSLLDPEELEKERLVILEEYLRKQDEPGGLLWEEIYDVSFERSPYRQTILGTEESIKGITRSAMSDYFERYYGPGNMVAIFSGDITPDEARTLGEEFFGDWNRQHSPLDNLSFDVTRASGQNRVINRDVNEAYVARAYPMPGIEKLPETIALDVMETILSDGASSRLNQRLVEETQTVYGINCSAGLHLYDGLFVVTGVMSPDKLEDFRTQVAEEFEKMADAGPTERELERAKTNIFTSTAFRTETTTGQSSTIGYCYTLTGSTEFEETYLDKMQEVTAEQVQEAAATYLLSNDVNEVAILPNS